MNREKLRSFLLEGLLVFIGVSAAVLICLVLVAYFDSFGGELIKDREKWGQFGDYLGGTLNPLLSFFTIAILIITTRLQKKELREAQAGIAASNAALSTQCEILAQQSYEQTFFRLFDDFKNDPFVIECCSKDKEISASVYKVWKERDNADYTLGDAFGDIVSSGSFAQVFSEKLHLMLAVISKLNNSPIYLKLVQAHIGPVMAAAICQYWYIKSARKYKDLLKLKSFMRGINVNQLYIKEVVEQFLPKQLDQFVKYANEIEAAFQLYAVRMKDKQV